VHLGSVYIYGSVGNIWSRQSKLLAADGAASDIFGVLVSIYDTTAMIGASGDDDKATDAGILVIYSRICIFLIASCNITILQLQIPLYKIIHMTLYQL
jgi:hypothetical protein